MRAVQRCRVQTRRTGPCRRPRSPAGGGQCDCSRKLPPWAFPAMAAYSDPGDLGRDIASVFRDSWSLSMQSDQLAVRDRLAIVVAPAERRGAVLTGKRVLR